MAQTIGSVLIDVKADTQKLVQGFSKAERTVENATKTMKNAIIGLASAASVNAFAGMVKSSIDLADNMGKAAEKIGTTTEFLSKMRYASSYVNVSVGQLDAALGAMTRRANNFVRSGGGAAAKAMEELGITTEFARENFTSTEKTFNILIEKLSKLPDGMRKTAIAQDLFSKSAADVVRLANLGADGIEKLGIQAAQTGNIISSDFAKQSADLNDSLNTLEKSFSGIANKLTIELAPSILTVTRKFEELLGVQRELSNFELTNEISKVQLKIKEFEDDLNTFSLADKIFGNGEDGKTRAELRAAKARLNYLNEELKLRTKIADTNGEDESNENNNNSAYIKSLKEQTSLLEKQLKTKNKIKTSEKEEIESLEDNSSMYKTYYETIGDYSSAWYYKEAELMEQYFELNEDEYSKLIDIARTEYFDKFLDENKKLQEDSHNIFNDISSSLTENFRTNFFDLITGDFDSFKSYLKNFGNDVFSTITNPIASNVSSRLATTLAGVIGLQNSGLAETLSSNGFSLVDGQWLGGGDTLDNANIVVSSSGEVLKGGNLLSGMPSVMDAVSLARTGYQIYEAGGIGAYISGSLGLGGGATLGPLGSLAGSAYGAGYTTIGNLLAGGNTVLTGGTLSGASGSVLAGGVATAGIAGGVSGYALGSLGDSLFGADTKAADYGAIGGAIGATIGSVVPVIGTFIGGAIGSALGSVIGGAFGKTKQTGSGLYSAELISSDSIDAIESYIDYKKKSWFSSKSWTVYKELDEKTRRAIETTFETVDIMADTLLGVTDSVISLAAGKYSGETLLEKALPKALIQEVMGATSDVVYDLWAEYAKAIDKSVIEAMQDKVSEYRETLRQFTLYNIDDDVEKLKQQYSYAQSDYELLAKNAGVDLATLTVENFTKYYQDAIRDDFTQDTIDLWEQLGDALLNADTALQSYNEALEAQTESLSAYMTNANVELSTFLSTTFTSFISSFDDIKNGIDNLSSRAKDFLFSMTSNNSSSTSEQIIAYNNLRSQFKSYFDENGNLLNGIDNSKATDTYNNLASLASSIGQESTFLKNVLINEFENDLSKFDITNQTLKVSIVDGLGELLNLNSGQVDALQKVASDGEITNEELNSIGGLSEAQRKGIEEVANNSTYFSTEETLTSLSEYAQAQLEALRSANESQTEKLSSKTFLYGDTIGKQEQIDLAELFGTPYENIASYVEQVQALDVSNNVQGDVEKLLGYENGIIKDENSLSMIRKLFPYVGDDVVSAVSNTMIKDNFYSRYQEAQDIFEKEKAESDQARDLYAQKWQTAFRGWNPGGRLIEEDFEKGVTLAHTTYQFNARSIGNKSPYEHYYKPYAKEFQEARSAYQALQLLEQEKPYYGFMNGTSNMLDDQLAMFNQKEIVVPTSFSDGIRQGELSLGNNNELIESVEKLIDITVQQARKIQQLQESFDEFNTRDIIKTAKGVA